MLILLAFQHFYMTKSEAFASDFVDSLKSCDLQDFYCCMKKKEELLFAVVNQQKGMLLTMGKKHFNKLVMLSQEIYVPASDGLLSH